MRGFVSQMSSKRYLALVSVIVLLASLFGCASDQQKASIDASIATKLGAHVKLIGEIGDRTAVNSDFDPAGYYLTVSRGSGFRQSIVLKRKVDALRRNSIELLLLLDMLPVSDDVNLAEDRRELKDYLSELVFRLDLIEEIYMLGGELPLQSERAPDFIWRKSGD